jgi:hypothetical protein
LALRTHVAHFTQDFKDRSEEERGHHARKSRVLCQLGRNVHANQYGLTDGVCVLSTWHNDADMRQHP